MVENRPVGRTEPAQQAVVTIVAACCVVHVTYTTGILAVVRVSEDDLTSGASPATSTV